MRRWALHLLVVVVLAFAPEARAESQAEQHFRRGLKLYDSKHFAAASVEFEQAYDLDSRPDYLFAWAQAKRQDGDCATAKSLYEEFLKVTKTPAHSAAARRAMTECKPRSPELAEDGPLSETAPERSRGAGGNVIELGKGEERPRPASSVLWSFRARVDVDPSAPAAVGAPGIGVAGRRWEVFGNALLGGNKGLEVGARLVPIAVKGMWTPFVSASMPVFFADGARVNGRGALGIRCAVGAGWAVTAEGGAAYALNPPIGVTAMAGLLSFGVELWY